MSLILFFGLAALIFIVGTVFTVLVIRHHYQKSRLSKAFPKQENEQLTH